jgi:fibronectin type 3 domain-containing protein
VGRTFGENAVGFQDRTVAAGTTYRYRVRAVGAAGPSAYSGAAQVTTSLIMPPAAPSGLSGVGDGPDVTLTWQDNSTDELQFPIERCTGQGCTNFSQVNAVNANVTTFTDYDTAAGVTYSYRVRGWNSGGYSGYSNVATVKAGGTVPVPTAPQGLRATALSRTRIALQWANTTGHQATLRIERCQRTACTAFAQIAEVAGTATSFTDNGLRARTAYTYRIRAAGGGGVSPYSNTATATTR